MAATANITIANYAAVSKVFTPSVAVPNGYMYRETSSPAGAPMTLRVTHVIPEVSSSSNTKAGVRFAIGRANSAAQMRTSYIDVSISSAKDGTTDADVSDLGAYIRNFLTDANIKTLLIGGF